MDKSFKPLTVIPDAGTVIAMDGATAVVTPYPDCYLIMPPSGTVKKGGRTVRMSRPVDPPAKARL